MTDRTPYRVTTLRYVSGAALATVQTLRPTTTATAHRRLNARHARVRRARPLELALVLLHYAAAFRYVRESALGAWTRLATVSGVVAVLAVAL